MVYIKNLKTIGMGKFKERTEGSFTRPGALLHLEKKVGERPIS